MILPPLVIPGTGITDDRHLRLSQYVYSIGKCYSPDPRHVELPPSATATRLVPVGPRRDFAVDRAVHRTPRLELRRPLVRVAERVPDRPPRPRPDALGAPETAALATGRVANWSTARPEMGILLSMIWPNVVKLFCP